jgi:hypothetical protein
MCVAIDGVARRWSAAGLEVETTTIFAHRRCSSMMLVKSIACERLGEGWPSEGEWWMSASAMSGTVDDMACGGVDRSARGGRVAAHGEGK